MYEIPTMVPMLLAAGNPIYDTTKHSKQFCFFLHPAVLYEITVLYARVL